MAALATADTHENAVVAAFKDLSPGQLTPLTSKASSICAAVVAKVDKVTLEKLSLLSHIGVCFSSDRAGALAALRKTDEWSSALAYFGEVEAQLQKCAVGTASPWLAGGDSITADDVAVATALRLTFETLIGSPASCDEGERFPAIASWLKRCLSLPEFVSVIGRSHVLGFTRVGNQVDMYADPVSLDFVPEPPPQPSAGLIVAALWRFANRDQQYVYFERTLTLSPLFSNRAGGRGSQRRGRH